MVRNLNIMNKLKLLLDFLFFWHVQAKFSSYQDDDESASRSFCFS